MRILFVCFTTSSSASSSSCKSFKYDLVCILKKEMNIFLSLIRKYLSDSLKIVRKRPTEKLKRKYVILNAGIPSSSCLIYATTGIIQTKNKKPTLIECLTKYPFFALFNFSFAFHIKII